MLRRYVVWMSFGVFVAGCDGCSSGAEERARAESEREASGGGERADAPPEPGPPPTVRLRGTVDRHERSVSARIESLGPEVTEVGSALDLQRRAGDESWEDVDGVTLTLRDRCGAEPTECIRLAPGAVFIPPPWRGVIGEGQCGECEGCAAAGPGTYRFVVRGCGQTEPAVGLPFELP